MKFFVLLGLLALVLFSSMVGAVSLDLKKIFVVDTMEYQIFWQVRLPRVLLAFMSGGILALSGLLFQTIFRNVLTTPFTLGISSGATLGAASAIILGIEGSFLGISLLSWFGFLGALLTLLAIYLFWQMMDDRGESRLLLAGIALSFLYSSLLLLLYYLSDFEESYLIMRYTMGSLLTVGYGEIVPIFFAMLFLLFVAFYYRYQLKLLAVSYTFAFLQGVDVERVTMVLFFSISLGVGFLVSITGPIGFIGLIVPHMVAFWVRATVERLLLPTFLMGGVFLLLCDTLVRALPTASQMPVGVLTSLIGGVVFVGILLKK